MKAKLADIEDRRPARLEGIERERNINILPPKKIASFP
jgi:hypothetical protein